MSITFATATHRAPTDAAFAAGGTVMARSRTVGLMLVRSDGTVRGCNAALASILGYDGQNQLLGTSIHRLLLEAGDWTRWLALEEGIHSIEVAMRSKGGCKVVLSGDLRARRGERGELVAFELLLVNVTEQRSLYAALENTSRAEAVGALTSGVAHDFNNLLTLIVGNLFLLADNLRDNAELADKARLAADAASRGADLTKRLLSFAKHTPAPSPEALRLPVLKQPLYTLLERALGRKIDLTIDMSEDVWPVRADCVQLETLLINLAVAARDASRGEGALTVRVRNLCLADEQAAVLAVAAGDYVEIRIQGGRTGASTTAEKVDSPPARPPLPGVAAAERFARQVGGAMRIEGNGALVHLLVPRMHDDEGEALVRRLETRLARACAEA